MNSPSSAASLSTPGSGPAPALGIGTWHLGEDRSRSSRDVAAVGAALEQGLTLIDTAEMYADGGAEEVVGQAIRGRREQCYLVTKVLPQTVVVPSTPTDDVDNATRLRQRTRRRTTRGGPTGSLTTLRAR